METEPELSKFEVNEQTDPPPDLHTLQLTASYTHVFLSIRILHISYMEHNICILRHHIFHEIVQDPERLYPIQITFSVQTKQKARFGNIPRNLPVNNWFGLHPTVIAVFARVQANPRKAETAPGFRVTALKKT